MDNVRKVNYCINMSLSQTFKSYNVRDKTIVRHVTDQSNQLILPII
jgi:hypothetical protein